jgi:SOUL heme-binding protein
MKPFFLVRTTLLLIGFLGVVAMAKAIEEPVYKRLQTIGSVEIRLYEPQVQAVTVLPGKTSTSAGFSRLAGFIFGGNDLSMDIAMTAPVQETLGVDRPEMVFTLPSQYELSEIPQPRDSRVSLRSVVARPMAVIGFSGWATSSRVNRFERELRKTLSEQSIEVVGEAVLSQYNPPWTIPFLRRNEVALPISLGTVASTN